jgi:catechol 2,3-dioxygenase-like lactoylglutathione lyase family enzyme
MPETEIAFAGLNLVCRDLEATRSFYRLLGVPLTDDKVWRTASGPHHTERVALAGTCSVELDSRDLAGAYNSGYHPEAVAQAVIGFRLPTREAVDELHQRLVAAGHTSSQQPYDTFWGARYAIVADPDGRHVGLMSPSDPNRRSEPPDL